MSTNSTIAVSHADGTVSQIYVHWDGHVNTAGKCLVDNYNSLELAEQLVELGNLSELGARLDANAGETHSFEKAAPGVCVAYARDRGETEQEPERYDSLEQYRTECRSEEYDYLFYAGSWFVIQSGVVIGAVVTELAQQTA